MRTRLAVCVAALLCASACAPMFDDARMLRPGQVEVTPTVSPVFVSENGDTTHISTEFGVRASVGATSRINVTAGYNRTQTTVIDTESFGFNTIAFGPKFSLVPDRLAVAVPVGFAFGDEVETTRSWQIHPTLLMTVPFNEHFDFNPAVRFLIPTCDGCETLIAVHGGFGVRTSDRFTLRPEVAVIFNPGEDGVVWTFGFGVSIR